MLRSYSIIIPARNEQEGIARTVNSVRAALVFFEAHHPRAGEVTGEIVVVDDGSTDGTADAVLRLALDEPRIRLVRHSGRQGIGAARNTGVRHAAGDVLFFCNADDRHFPEHVLLGFSVLEHAMETRDPGAPCALLRIGNRGHVSLDPGRPVAALRTGVRVGAALHPFWRDRIRRALAQNLCVLRRAFDWIQGFPEEAVYVTLGGFEDVACNRTLDVFFRIGETELETVEYVRRPGNTLDRQVPRFSRAPDPAADVLSAEEMALHDVRLRIEDGKVGRLLDAWLHSGPPPVPAGMLNWAGVVGALAVRDRPDDARRVLEQARALGHALPSDGATPLA